MNPSRRQLLTGRIAKSAPELRPPWTVEIRLTELCTRCGDCARACTQGIIDMSGGLPRIRFGGQECTFCGDCATACAAGVFANTDTRPWTVTADIRTGCLLSAGIACRLCTDACDRAALRFDPRVRPVGEVRVDAEACTGCAACLSACPTGSLTLNDPRMTEAA